MVRNTEGTAHSEWDTGTHRRHRLLAGGTEGARGRAAVKTRRNSSNAFGVSRYPQLRAAPGSADRLAAASSPLRRERVPDEVFGVRHVHDAYAVAAGEQHDTWDPKV